MTELDEDRERRRLLAQRILAHRNKKEETPKIVFVPRQAQRRPAESYRTTNPLINQPRKLREMCERGMTNREIAKEFGVRPEQVKYAKYQLRIKTKQAKDRVKELVPKITELTLEGKTLKEISEELGITFAQVRWLKRIGNAPPARGHFRKKT